MPVVKYATSTSSMTIWLPHPCKVHIKIGWIFFNRIEKSKCTLITFALYILRWQRQRWRRRQWKTVKIDSIFKVLYFFVCACPFSKCATIIISSDLLAHTFLLSTNLFVLSFCGEKFSPKIIQTKLYIHKTCVAFNFIERVAFLLFVWRFLMSMNWDNIFRCKVWQTQSIFLIFEKMPLVECLTKCNEMSNLQHLSGWLLKWKI